MRAAVMRGAELVVDDIADPTTRCRPGSGARRWPAASAGPTCTPCSTATRWSRCRTRPADSPVTALPADGDHGSGPRRGHGPRVLRRGHRARREHGQLPGRRHRRVGAHDLRPGRPAPDRLLEPLSGRVRRADGAVGHGRAEGAERAWPRTSRRSPSRWPSVCTPANRSSIGAGQAAIVFGCGPVGLATIAALRLRDVEPIIAVDFSPTRRALATTMGAHAVADPREEPPIDVWRRPRRPDAHRPLRGRRRARACSTRRCAPRPGRARSWWSACAWSPTPCGRCAAW